MNCPSWTRCSFCAINCLWGGADKHKAVVPILNIFPLVQSYRMRIRQKIHSLSTTYLRKWCCHPAIGAEIIAATLISFSCPLPRALFIQQVLVKGLLRGICVRLCCFFPLPTCSSLKILFKISISEAPLLTF